MQPPASPPPFVRPFQRSPQPQPPHPLALLAPPRPPAVADGLTGSGAASNGTLWDSGAANLGATFERFGATTVLIVALLGASTIAAIAFLRHKRNQRLLHMAHGWLDSGDFASDSGGYGHGGGSGVTLLRLAGPNSQTTPTQSAGSKRCGAKPLWRELHNTQELSEMATTPKQPTASASNTCRSPSSKQRARVAVEGVPGVRVASHTFHSSAI